MSQRITAANQGALLEAVNADPEFRLAARYWNGSFRLTMGPDEAYLFRVRDGELMNVNLQPTVFDAWDFEIAGSKASLERLIRRPLRSFAYPFGALADVTMRITRDAGFVSPTCTARS